MASLLRVAGHHALQTIRFGWQSGVMINGQHAIPLMDELQKPDGDLFAERLVLRR